MTNRITIVSLVAAAGLALGAAPAQGQAVNFSTGNPDGRMAVASRPEATGAIEIEAADDFLLASDTRITSATFTGLIPSGAPTSSIERVVVEIYRVFPLDSDTTRTQHVPTRNNSPSDVAFDSRDSAATGSTGMVLQIQEAAASFAAQNSVLNGIHPSPNQQTLGEGPVSGEEVVITTTFNNSFYLPAGHYFFVPQVQLSSGDFFWLSAPRPIVAPGTPFNGDLQAWIRNGDLDPDWLRVGTDIIGGATPPTFNMTFTLTGHVITCYANCDESTEAPILNVNDFVCFQYEFVQGSPYANCDGSSIPPILNVNDFICFTQRFAAGCP
jgi:hypothetical protein